MPLWLWVLLGAGGLYLWNKSSSSSSQVTSLGQSAGVPPTGSAPGMINLTGNIFNVGQQVALTRAYTLTDGTGYVIPIDTHGTVSSLNMDGTSQIAFVAPVKQSDGASLQSAQVSNSVLAAVSF